MTTNEGFSLPDDQRDGPRLLPVIDAFMILDAAAREAVARKAGFDFALPVITAHERYAAQDPNRWQLFLNTGVDAVARIEAEGPAVVTKALTEFLKQNPAPPVES